MERSVAHRVRAPVARRDAVAGDDVGSHVLVPRGRLAGEVHQAWAAARSGNSIRMMSRPQEPSRLPVAAADEEAAAERGEGRVNARPKRGRGNQSAIGIRPER